MECDHGCGRLFRRQSAEPTPERAAPARLRPVPRHSQPAEKPARPGPPARPRSALSPSGVRLRRPSQNQRTACGIDAVLFGQHARGERVFGVPGQHGHRRLDDDRARIERWRDEMDGAAVNPHARFERTPVRVQSGERGQQRRVNVEAPPVVARDKARREHPHESGENDEVGLVAVDLRCQRGFEILAPRMRAMIDDGRRDTERRGSLRVRALAVRC